MSNQNVLVSVLMTAYNREKYIAEAIQSVLDSTYRNFELIIVDDCSKDKTVEIAKSFEIGDNRIKVYINEKNLGDYPNRNKAASYAKGKYLKYLDSDDIIYPWGLYAMVDCMEKFPEAGFGLMAANMNLSYKIPITFTPEEAYKLFFFKSGLFMMGPSGSIIKREVFEKLNGFSGKPYIGDLEMWLKLAKKYPVVAMPLQLIWWREHDAQQINIGNNSSYYENNNFLIYQEMLKSQDCPLNDAHKLQAYRNQLNMRSRVILKDILKLKLIKAYINFAKYNLSFSDLFYSLKKNQNG